MHRRNHGAARGVLAGLVVVAVLALGSSAFTGGPAPAAAAQTAGETVGTGATVTITTLRPLPEDAGHIVSRPNSGRPPAHSGDRGGWQQTLVFGLVMGGVGVAGALAWRDSKRRRTAPPSPDGRSDG